MRGEVPEEGLLRPIRRPAQQTEHPVGHAHGRIHHLPPVRHAVNGDVEGEPLVWPVPVRRQRDEDGGRVRVHVRRHAEHRFARRPGIAADDGERAQHVHGLAPRDPQPKIRAPRFLGGDFEQPDL